MTDYTGGPGNDVFNGTEDNDVAQGAGGDDTLNGNGGNDRLSGDDGDDTLNGGDGIDFLTGGAGRDILNGGAGDDYFLYDQAADFVAGESIDGGTGLDQISIGFQSFGTPVDLSSLSITNVESLQALGSGFVGTVMMTAQQLAGFTFYVDALTIQLTTGGSVTIDNVLGRHNSIVLANAATTLDLRNDIDNAGSRVTGGSGDDVIYGSLQFTDQITGGGGNDTIGGGNSRDRLSGGDGNDTIRGGGDEDYLFGDAGDDILYGEGGYNHLTGGTGLDRLYGGDSDDEFIIDAQDELVAGEVYDGGSGTDTLVIMSGGTFDLSGVTLNSIERLQNTYATVILSTAQLAAGFTYVAGSIKFATSGAVVLTGSYSNATFIFNEGGNALDASQAQSGIGAIGSTVVDSIIGSDFRDDLNGGGGNDTIDGRGGNDRISGGAGADSLAGGSGDDVFIYDSAADYVAGETIDGGTGVDIIRAGFNFGNGTLDLSSASLTLIEGIDMGPYSANVRLTAAQLDALTAIAGNITLTTSGSVSLAGVVSASETSNPNGSFTLSSAGNTLDLTGYWAPFTNVFGGIAADTIIGGSVMDTIYGNGGNDTINGGGGNDVIHGGAGADTLSGGDGDDVFVLDLASDLVAGESYDGGAGLDILQLNGNLTVNVSSVNLGGIDGIDATFGRVSLTAAQLDALTAVAGNFILTTAGSVSLDGVVLAANTTTTFTLSNFGNVLDLTGSNVLAFQVTGGSAADGIIGTVRDDRFYGGGGDDMLVGAGGNDLLDGGTGLDQLYGGLGNDTFYVDQQSDVVFENANEGTDTVISTSNFYLYANIENLTLEAGSGNIFGVGNELANVITGNEGANTLLGGGGADTIRAGAGVDILYGETGDDQLFGDGGNDFLAGGIGDDTLDGGTGGDSLFGEDGNDTLTGGSDFVFDQLVGGAGDDVLRGDSGLGDYDYLYGNAGNDSFYVDTPADLVFEQANEGTDTVYASINGGGYYLYDNIENLVLLGNTPFGVGNALANRLTGNAQGNYLLGGGGNDVLNGKGGNDVLFGEAGADTFVFERGTGGDVIGDFVVGTDKIDLSAFGFASFAAVQAATGQNGTDSFINLGGGDFIVLNGVAQSSLQAGDFILTAGQSAGIPLADFDAVGDAVGRGALADIGDDSIDHQHFASPVSDTHDWLKSRFTLDTLDFNPTLSNGGPLTMHLQDLF